MSNQRISRISIRGCYRYMNKLRFEFTNLKSTKEQLNLPKEPTEELEGEYDSKWSTFTQNLEAKVEDATKKLAEESGNRSATGEQV
jgi:hypothetical protein